MMSKQRLGRARNQAQGFTLLEVVVALAVLALTLGVIYEALGWSLRRSAVTQRKEVAWLHAQSILSSLRIASELRSGAQAGEAAGTQWRIEIRERSSEVSDASAIVPFEVVVTVPWGAKVKETIELKSIELAKRPL